jgi:hypothetical protein
MESITDHTQLGNPQKEYFYLNCFNLQSIVQDLLAIGASSVPLLQEPFRLRLLQEAESYVYQRRVGVVGVGDRQVYEEYSLCETFSPNSLFSHLKTAFQVLMNDQFQQLEINPFIVPLQFDSMALHRYFAGELGITPHRDSLRSINLVCLFNVAGEGNFFVCADRQGNQRIAIDTAPGSVILLRAPGFYGSSLRPFHTVTQFRSTRYSFGLRQRKSEEAATAT